MELAGHQLRPLAIPAIKQQEPIPGQRGCLKRRDPPDSIYVRSPGAVFFAI